MLIYKYNLVSPLSVTYLYDFRVAIRWHIHREEYFSFFQNSLIACSYLSMGGYL